MLRKIKEIVFPRFAKKEIVSFELPYTSPKGRHRHKCDACGHVWEHGDCNRNNDAKHTCSKCGNEQWDWYEGEEPPLEFNK